MKLALLLASFAFALPAFAADGDWRLIYDRSVEVPDGDSYSGDFLLQVTDATQLKVEMRDDRGARCDTQTTAIDVSHSSGQRIYDRYLPDAQGVFTLAKPSIVYIKFYNFQDRWRTAYCRRIVWAKATVDRPNDDFVIAGVARYEGGFQSQEVQVLASTKVVKVKVDVPSFCTGVSVLTLETKTEGFWDAAEAQGDGVFEINGGAGSRISSIRVTLNGPRGTGCDVPLWTSSAAD